jgi:putative iron-dependent peroxidase
MLENMFVGSPPGNYDRVLDFSTPVTGALFYVPASGFLEDPPAPSQPEPENAPVPEPDASLGIGSLRWSARS